ncbi:conserved hypothetical protein [Paraburkholderia ribeironis]|uniref:Uncharacterized protein n=1 Tax=Paraburkholderia ribeironis TaxID=1247936 RepID=A0A1N7S669_9BURK|nr:conserved hypothetical protein [Paraburkholderia ribeironis]
MHAPYAAQYRVMGGSGAGSGGSFTPDAAFASSEPAACGFDAPRSALVADAAVVAVVALPVVASLAVFAGAAAVAAVATGALAPGAVAADGMLALIGAAEKVLDGNGGRDGTPVDELLLAGGVRGGICGSRRMSTLVLWLASAKHNAVSTPRR